MNRAELDEHCRALDLLWPATIVQIKAAHREQVSVWHPDRFSDASRKQKAEQKLKRINLALQALQALLAAGLGGLCASCSELVDDTGSCSRCEGARADARRNVEEAARRAAAEAKRQADARAAAAEAKHQAEARAAVAEAKRQAEARAAAQGAPAPRHAPAPRVASPPPAPPERPAPELRIAGTWRSADGAETWLFQGQDPHFTFEITVHNPFLGVRRIGHGRAVRNGFVLQVTGALTPMDLVAQTFALPFLSQLPGMEQPFFLPLQWDGAMLRGVIQNGFMQNLVGLVPVG